MFIAAKILCYLPKAQKHPILVAQVKLKGDDDIYTNVNHTDENRVRQGSERCNYVCKRQYKLKNDYAVQVWVGGVHLLIALLFTFLQI